MEDPLIDELVMEFKDYEQRAENLRIDLGRTIARLKEIQEERALASANDR